MGKFKNRVLNILFWSVVSAAFIGPGTVTTATKAGAEYQFDLLWSLVFATFACLLLQEASARITINSGMNLGQAIAKQFEGRSTKTLALILVIGAIILGSAAYETGNILGSIAGLLLIFDIPKNYFVIGIGALAILALNLKSIPLIARIMGGVVFFMGIAFFTTAIQLGPSFEAILRGAFTPTIPKADGSGLIILALIGTTVVPYDLFLGSGVLDKKQAISEMRFGLSVAVILGGIISMAIMAVGTVITADFTYEALAQALTYNIGPYAVYIFGFGMFAAGFSSAITAPLASAITARSLFDRNSSVKWKTNGRYFRMIYLGVLSFGLIFGILNVNTIYVITIAQALNGLILPFISIFLIFVINDPCLMGEENVNSWTSNILMAIVVWVTMIIGSINILKAIQNGLIKTDLLSKEGFITDNLIITISILAFFLSIGILFLIKRFRSVRFRLIIKEDDLINSL